MDTLGLVTDIGFRRFTPAEADVLADLLAGEVWPFHGAARVDLDDGTPMFDLRVRELWRGRGVGTVALRWLTSYLFTELPSSNRLEGTTREDNHAMRRLSAKRVASGLRRPATRRSW